MSVLNLQEHSRKAKIPTDAYYFWKEQPIRIKDQRKESQKTQEGDSSNCGKEIYPLKDRLLFYFEIYPIQKENYYNSI